LSRSREARTQANESENRKIEEQKENKIEAEHPGVMRVEPGTIFHFNISIGL